MADAIPGADFEVPQFYDDLDAYPSHQDHHSESLGLTGNVQKEVMSSKALPNNNSSGGTSETSEGAYYGVFRNEAFATDAGATSAAADSESPEEPAPIRRKLRRSPPKGKAVDEYEAYAELPSFPPSTTPLPPHISMEEICRDWPNHLVGEGLDPFIQRMWSGLDIYNSLTDTAREEFKKEGVTISSSVNRANFMIKRLGKRMDHFTPETMKALVEGPKLRPCMINGRELLGRSKLQGKYHNPRAAAFRGRTTPPQNERVKRLREESTGSDRSGNQKRARANTTSNTTMRRNGRAVTRARTSASTSTASVHDGLLPLAPIRFKAADVATLSSDGAAFCSTKAFQWYLDEMKQHWGKQRYLSGRLLELDTMWKYSQNDGRGEALLQMCGWPLSYETLALMNVEVAENRPEFTTLVFNRLKSVMEQLSNINAPGAISSAPGENNPLRVAALSNDAVRQILDEASTQGRHLNALLGHCIERRVKAASGLVMAAVFGNWDFRSDLVQSDGAHESTGTGKVRYEYPDPETMESGPRRR